MNLPTVSLDELRRFRDDLDSYIRAREQAEAGAQLAQIEQDIAALEREMESLDAELSDQDDLVRQLTRTILGEETGGGGMNGHEMNGHTPGASRETVAGRDVMSKRLGVSPSTLWRWVKRFEAHLTPDCVTSHGQHFNAADQEVMETVKTLRDKGCDYNTVEARLTEVYQ